MGLPALLILGMTALSGTGRAPGVFPPKPAPPPRRIITPPTMPPIRPPPTITPPYMPPVRAPVMPPIKPPTITPPYAPTPKPPTIIQPPKILPPTPPTIILPPSLPIISPRTPAQLISEALRKGINPTGMTIDALRQLLGY